MMLGYLAKVSSVSTVISISSSEMIVCRFVGPSVLDETGDRGAVLVSFRVLSLDILFCALCFLFFDALPEPIVVVVDMMVDEVEKFPFSSH